VTAVVVATLIPAEAAFAFTDVPADYWDYTAIHYVASTHSWMRDYGNTQFRPTTRETRSFLARTLVTVYAPNERIDSKITFSDLSRTDPFYRFANVSVKLGWLQKYSGDRWAGGSSVPRSLFDQAIILAMGLKAQARGLANIHESDGTNYDVSGRWPHMQLASFLGLHYNHKDETKDMQISTLIHRDEVAYSLYTALKLPSWELDNSTKFDTVSLPALDARNAGQKVQHQLTQYALNFVGYPYIWGGEWNVKSPSGYCCGYQPQGGFDCSGFVWWVLKKNEDGYDAAQFRVYPGWVVHERTSHDMAHMAPSQIPFSKLVIGNLMFFASNGGHNWTDVDHVGMYIGNNWMMHSTGGGPQLQWVGSGWYRDHFVWGRGLLGHDQGREIVPPTWLVKGEPAVGPNGS